MKIDTKKATPVVKGPPECKIVDNVYIPSTKKENDKDGYGRELAYDLTMILTTILTSKRIEKSPHRVSQDDLDDLCANISKMLLKEEDDTEDSDIKSEMTKLGAKDKPLAKPLGRFEVDVVTSSNKIVRVTRSLRLLTA